MSNKSNVVTTLKSELANTPKEHPLYAINAVRPALMQRIIDGSRRALRKADAEDAGIKAGEFDAWIETVDDLYEASKDYYEKLGTDEEESAKAEVAEAWKRCVRAGEKDVLTPKMYIRPTDVHNCRVWATEIDTKNVRGVGTVGVYTGKERFRGIIETRIALRIAGNAILKDDDREILEAMDRALRTIAHCNDLLNGYTQGKNVVASLDAQILDAKSTLDAVRDALHNAGVDSDKIASLTRKQKALVDDLTKQLTDVKKRLRKAEGVRDEIQSKYDSIVDALDEIEGGVETAPKDQETREEGVARHEEARAQAKAKALAKKAKKSA